MKKWTVRKGGGRGGVAPIGRMYFINPSMGEKYYLRLLLTKVKGATSFESLRTVRRHDMTIQVCETFKEAAIQLGLLEDDRDNDNTLADCVLYGMPVQLRELFSMILLYNEVADAPALWEKYRSHFIEDFEHTYTRIMQLPPPQDLMYNKALLDINQQLLVQGKNTTTFGLPMAQVDMIDPSDAFASLPRLEQIELRHDHQARNARLAIDVPKLNAHQASV
jgi:hypothetical protein